ncbi:MAG: toll/interleukin-1 receptor domain-containing protein [Chloroflexi bacterium]|nr:toll/interleukin-1 receptor domain-containing protein [Chloroflexota bacterium]
MAETQFKYDVFISYNHADEKWVVGALLPTLENAGLKACLDDRDLIAGRKAHVEIEQALKASRALILVLSKHWFKGEWTQFEIDIAITRDPAGKRYPIIPLLREAGIESRIPASIQRFNWIDFTRKDQALAWKQLSDALGNPATFKPSNLQPETHWFYGHRYGDLATFTGRAAEMQMLDEWLANDTDNLLLITAFGGFGKSALTWQWFNNRVDKAKWQTAVWWSFYEKESGFESFLAETLNHLGVEVKQSARLQLNDLLEAMRGTNILIVLDGFERSLRQYGRMDAALQSDDEDADIDPSQRDCSSPLTETFLRGLSGAGMKSKVLMTTRLCPRVLESADGKLLRGRREEPLAAFSPEDAVTYFHNEGVKATRAEVIEACGAYGYHPLSLSLLVGLINADHERRGDIAAVKNLEIFEDVKARRHHVLERAYGSLAPERRDLLSKMSCFRGSMEYAVLKKVFPSPDLDKTLLDLRKRGLLQYVSPLLLGEGAGVRYDMHPIVRHYAYDRFTDSERKETHKDLAFHFIDIMVDVMPMPNRKVKTLEDLAPVIELYHHMVGAGNLDEATLLYYQRLKAPIYFQFGSYQLAIELLRALFLDGEDAPPRLKREDAQAFALNELANAYALSGQPRRAVPLFIRGNEPDEKSGNKKGVAIGLGNMAQQQLDIGALNAAERNLRRQIDLCRVIADEFAEAVGHLELGRVLSYRGVWQEAGENLLIAQNVFEKAGPETNFGSVNLSYLALRDMLLLRLDTTKQQYLLSALNFCRRALEWSDNTTRIVREAPRDYIRAYWLLGAAYRANTELTLAEENLSKALNLCRQINAIDAEADILLDVARLRYAQGDFKDAQEKASEALVITEWSGYVLQGADVNLFLAQYALEQEKDKAKAKQYAETALKLAYCDGPPYYYKVAHEEAERMLEKLK